ncbi:MAG: SDR family oxidoreductase [Candidatus Marinimicrobia bacterium]|jgi:NAD(P)-dependent dehydrogenase (short-subunit alcohol dehydrogenase family)|nr:SDR family oxidoreductase [Candidatus Neomarinimicrobiota bacterium]MBT3796678.1 SDR family oxidoreductase [Candidatus Neomarinimicrobiota bacterium]MBT4317929.1 SDR family oxidoreductase [Candidatus Neomarinimicrobiota bacterium]MBT4784425.1 SDR family oxidoreductase [Candidatus Neomarinimicrobiota bacterium]MBT5097573.1 SDR family oxidoreductase [Candidatus Neomarinimicrobiota bacterium]
MSSSYIIIGASGGIGSQLVADLESCGHNLLLGYHNEKLDAISSKSKFAPVEATNFDSVMSLVEQGINEFGQIDGLINLPGSIILKPPHLITEKEFHATVDINLKSAFACIRAAGKLMQKSSVLLMSSAAVSIGLGNHEMIVAAKAGIESMVRSASKTYARKELRFNAIAPSLTNTPLSKNIVNNPISLKASEKMHPVGRIGVPKDISNAIKFLIDPKNNWITGQTLSVDGGMSSTK